MAAACATNFILMFFPALETYSLTVQNYNIQSVWIVFAISTVTCYKLI
jgi:hypothetical protein